MQEMKFLYKDPEIKKIIPAILLFGCFTVFSYFYAIDKKELNFKGIHLSKDISIIVHWSLFVFFLAIVIFSLYIFIKLIYAKKIKKHLTFKTNSLSAYKGVLDDRLIHIRYSDITNIKFHKLKHLKSIQIKHKDGYLTVTNSSFSESDYMQICAIVIGKTNHLLKS
ncbi:MAG: hypothetical protein AABY33_05820 [Pseudomonadota bacterium]